MIIFNVFNGKKRIEDATTIDAIADQSDTARKTKFEEFESAPEISDL